MSMLPEGGGPGGELGEGEAVGCHREGSQVGEDRWHPGMRFQLLRRAGGGRQGLEQVEGGGSEGGGMAVSQTHRDIR